MGCLLCATHTPKASEDCKRLRAPLRQRAGKVAEPRFLGGVPGGVPGEGGLKIPGLQLLRRWGGGPTGRYMGGRVEGDWIRVCLFQTVLGRKPRRIQEFHIRSVKFALHRVQMLPCITYMKALLSVVCGGLGSGRPRGHKGRFVWYALNRKP